MLDANTNAPLGIGMLVLRPTKSVAMVDSAGASDSDICAKEMSEAWMTIPLVKSRVATGTLTMRLLFKLSVPELQAVRLIARTSRAAPFMAGNSTTALLFWCYYFGPRKVAHTTEK